jgi:hypothetical protein
VFVDGKTKIITLVCSVCDRTLSTIHVKGNLPPSRRKRVP